MIFFQQRYDWTRHCTSWMPKYEVAVLIFATNKTIYYWAASCEAFILSCIPPFPTALIRDTHGCQCSSLLLIQKAVKQISQNAYYSPYVGHTHMLACKGFECHDIRLIKHDLMYGFKCQPLSVLVKPWVFCSTLQTLTLHLQSSSDIIEINSVHLWALHALPSFQTAFQRI